jgi:putative transposase
VPSLSAIERKSRDRDEAIRAAYASGGYTLAEIGDHFGLHYSTVSRIAAETGGDDARNKT